ncbi:hypothetical protein HanIR_Chr06g0271721 [Helianthus annuus]|nr:hypothetical protein HanIR_Chr06g0271721 [Helianthus annuus]
MVPEKTLNVADQCPETVSLDHLTYFGVELGCDTPSKCSIVMTPNLASYGDVDDNGNFALYREPKLRDQ